MIPRGRSWALAMVPMGGHSPKPHRQVALAHLEGSLMGRKLGLQGPVPSDHWALPTLPVCAERSQGLDSNLDEACAVANKRIAQRLQPAFAQVCFPVPCSFFHTRL